MGISTNIVIYIVLYIVIPLSLQFCNPGRDSTLKCFRSRYSAHNSPMASYLPQNQNKIFFTLILPRPYMIWPIVPFLASSLTTLLDGLHTSHAGLLVVLQYLRHPPTPGPLHLLFLGLKGGELPTTYPSSLCSNVILSVRQTLSALFKSQYLYIHHPLELSISFLGGIFLHKYIL